MKANEITQAVIGAAIEVHRALGPGLLESAYEECLAHEFDLRGLSYVRQMPLPLVYKAVHLDCGYRIDFLVEGLEGLVVVELKAVESLHPIHEAQLLSYLRLGEWNIGLIINFNEVILKNGIRRRVLNFSES
jgi:GxxExxY protein